MNILNKAAYLSIGLMLAFCLSCQKNEFSSGASFSEEVSLAVTSPSSTVYTNSTNYDFDWNASIDELPPERGSFSTFQQSTVSGEEAEEKSGEHLELRFFNNTECSENSNLNSLSVLNRGDLKPIESPLRLKENFNDLIKENREDPTVKTRKKFKDQVFFNTTISETFKINELTDGDILSAKLIYIQEGIKKESACSPAVYVDHQTPQSVSIINPLSDTYIGEGKFQLRYSPARDFGIAGLAELPYEVTLFDSPNCLGNKVEQVRTKNLEVDFEGLLSDKLYSARVVTVDKADNRSAAVCSASIEVDLSVPVLNVFDPSSTPGFTKTTMPQVTINNAPGAAYFCITEDAGFAPINTASLCPGLNGWTTGAPINTSVSAVEGLKDLYLWTADTNGDLLSNRKAVFKITLDNSAVSDSSILGAGGNLDVYYDDWLFSTQTPVLKIGPSLQSDAYRYKVSALDMFNNVVCAAHVKNHPFDLFDDFTCELSDGETYQAVLISYDRALNTAEVRSNFTLDLSPPGAFDILGVDGGLDTAVDQFIGQSLPRIHYTDSAEESSYHIEIRDAVNDIFCIQEVSGAGVLNYDYGLNPPVDCGDLVQNENYFVSVYAEDLAKNRTYASNNNWSFKADLSPPEHSIDSAPEALLGVDTADFEFSAADDISSVSNIECSLDGAAFTVCASPLNYSGLSDGVHTFEVRAVDVAGNVSGILDHSWTVDLLNPTLSIDSRPASYSNAATSQVDFSAVDTSGIQRFECRENSGAWATCVSPWSRNLAEGTYTLEVKAIDNMDRETVETVSWIVDRTQPTLSFIQPLSNSSSPAPTGSSLVLFSVADSVSSASSTCSWDGAPAVSCSGMTTQSGLTAGTHTLLITVVDEAGNVLVVSNSFVMTTHSWAVGAFGACSANPTWTGYGSCSANPSWTGYGACSRTCGGGTQSRSCVGTSGSQSRSCVGTSGVRTRAVTCMRSNGSTQTAVSDGQCSDAKPTLTQACSAGCSGSATRSCTSSCSGSSSRSCNTQACVATNANCSGWVHAAPFPRSPSFGGGLSEAQCRNACVNYAINTMRVTPGTVFSCHRHTNGSCEGWLAGDQRIPPTWCNGCRVSACTAQ